jgi:hypothetical protein
MRLASERLLDIFALSFGFWMVYGVYSILKIKGFMVERYERKTQLHQTLYFRRYLPFTKYLPDFFSSGMYVAHLLWFVWFWKVVLFIKKKRPQVNYFDDIDSPEDVTKHFTDKEIGLAKRPAYAFAILFIHVIVFYILKQIFPGGSVELLSRQPGGDCRWIRDCDNARIGPIRTLYHTVYLCKYWWFAG